MVVKKETHEKMSLIDLARQLMEDTKEAMTFAQLYKKVTQIKGLSDTEKRARMSQFYTDLNADGIFAINQDNQWILKRWHRNEYKSEGDIG